MRRRLKAVVAVLWLAVAGAPAWGQREGAVSPATPDEALAVHVFTLSHQSAQEAMTLVLPLLSPKGTVEIRPGGNTLVIRDSLAALSRIVPVLRSFDHPARELEVRLWLVSAGRAGPVVGGDPPAAAPPEPLPVELVQRLRAILPYERYQLRAASDVRGLEGQAVTFDLGPYGVAFTLGTALADQRVRLNRFQIDQPAAAPGQEREVLLRSNLNLWLGRTMVVGITPGGESERALMVVLRCALTGERGGGG